jgi:microcystin-dependent protein
MENFLGAISIVGFNYPVVNYSFCDGSLIPISNHQALYSLLGTTYGGNGMMDFGLPDLRGRIPIHIGQGPGLIPRTLGEVAGTEKVTLLPHQIPPHSHKWSVSLNEPSSNEPNNIAFGSDFYYSENLASTTTTMSTQTIGNSGSGGGHPNMMPTLALNFQIALTGTYPTRT